MKTTKTYYHFQFLRFLFILLGTIFFLFSYHKSLLFKSACLFIFVGFWFVTILFVFFFKKFGFKPKLFWLELLADLVLSSLLVFYTGGRESPFIFLFPLLIFMASFHLGRRGADFFILAALVSYSFIFWRPPAPSPLDPETILQFFIPLGAMGLLGILALKFADEIRKTQEKYQKTSEALFRAEELHRHILHSLASGLIITDLDFTIVSANKAAKNILCHQELKGKKLSQIIPELNPYNTCMRSELKIRDKYLGYSLFPLKDEKGSVFGYGFIFQDITEIKEQEKRLRQAEHLAALGTMASGLIHEIKNPLASICGAVEFLKEEKLVAADGLRLLDIIARESARLDKLVSDFLLFARPSKGNPEKILVKDLVYEIFEELKISYPNFRLECYLEDNFYLFLERDRLKQVLLNLFLNAIEASSEDLLLKIWSAVENDKVKLFVEDNAGGIHEEIEKHIFEPFFTTKPQGTGLGLAVTYSLMKNWGGSITLERVPQGSRFILQFPKEKTA